MKILPFLRRLAIAILLAGGVVSTSHAHAFLDHASPAVGSTVRTPPGVVTIWFTEAVEPAFSRITVTDPAGRRIDQGKAFIGKNPEELSVKLAATAPGTYRVHWHAVSVDTHRTEGHFTFTLAPD